MTGHYPSGNGEHPAYHWFGETTCKRILLARVKRCDELEIAKHIRCTVSKLRSCGERNPSQPAIRVERSIETNPAESDNNSDVFEKFEFPEKIRPAVGNFFWLEFVLRRGTAAGCSNVAIRKLQSIVAVNRCWLIGKAGLVERAVKPVTALIAGEHAASTVAAVRRGRKSNEQETSVRITEARVWFPPILLVCEPLHLFMRNLLPPTDKARAEPTRDDLRLEGLELGHARLPKRILVGGQAKAPSRKVAEEERMELVFIPSLILALLKLIRSPSFLFVNRRYVRSCFL